MAHHLTLGLLLIISTLGLIQVKAHEDYIKQQFIDEIDDTKNKTELAKERNEALKEQAQIFMKEMERADFNYTSTKHSLGEEYKKLLKYLHKLNFSIDIMEHEIGLLEIQIKILRFEDKKYKFAILILKGDIRYLKKRKDASLQEECSTILGEYQFIPQNTGMLLIENEIYVLHNKLLEAKLKLNEAEYNLRNTDHFLNALKLLLQSRKENYNKFIDDFIDTGRDTNETINALEAVDELTREKRNKLMNERDYLTESTIKELLEAQELKEEIQHKYKLAKFCYVDLIGHV